MKTVLKIRQNKQSKQQNLVYFVYGYQLGAKQNLSVIQGWCNLKIEVTRKLSPYPVYYNREISVSPVHMINELKKVLTPYKSFMLKAQTALATGHFSNQLECAVQIRHIDLQYK